MENVPEGAGPRPLLTAEPPGLARLVHFWGVRAQAVAPSWGSPAQLAFQELGDPSTLTLLPQCAPHTLLPSFADWLVPFDVRGGGGCPVTACRPGTVPGETSEAVLGETPADLASPTPCGEGQVSLRAPKLRVAVLCPGRPLVHTRKEQPCVRLGQCSRAFPGGLGAAQRPGLWPAQPVSS